MEVKLKHTFPWETVAAPNSKIWWKNKDYIEVGQWHKRTEATDQTCGEVIITTVALFVFHTKKA